MKLPDRFRRLYAAVSRLQIPVYAGNAAFFLLLSCCPLAILLLALLPALPATQEDLLALFGPLVPAPLYPLLEYLLGELSRGRSPALLSVSALAAVWSSSKGILSIQRALNAVFGARPARGYLRRRALCILFTLLTLLALLLTLLGTVFGQAIVRELTALGLTLPRILAGLFRCLRLFSTLLLAVYFTALYRFLPDKRQPFPLVWPGALAAAAGWVLFSAAFSFYVNHFCGYSDLYGGLTTLLLTMLWLYGCLLIVFYCAFGSRLLRRGL